MPRDKNKGLHGDLSGPCRTNTWRSIWAMSNQYMGGDLSGPCRTNTASLVCQSECMCVLPMNLLRSQRVASSNSLRAKIDTKTSVYRLIISHLWDGECFTSETDRGDWASDWRSERVGFYWDIKIRTPCSSVLGLIPFDGTSFDSNSWARDHLDNHVTINLDNHMPMNLVSSSFEALRRTNFVIM
jgi:hypothetical protein